MALKPLNSAGGFSVGDYTTTTVIYPNTDVTTANLVVNNYSNLGDVANVYIGGGVDGQVLQTDGAGNLSWTSSANVSEIHNGNSNVTINDPNGNVYINANNGTDYQWNFSNNGTLYLGESGGGYGVLSIANVGVGIDILTGGPNYSEIYLEDAGNVTIATSAEDYQWIFDTNGVLVLSGQAEITAPSGSDIKIHSNNGGGYLVLREDGNVFIETAGESNEWQFNDVGDLLTPGDIYLGGARIRDRNNNGIQLYSTNYAELNYNNYNYIWVENGGAHIQTSDGSYEWTFDENANLTTPGNINLGGQAITDNNGQGIELYSTNYSQLNYNNQNYIYVENTGTTIESQNNSWTFDNNGNLTTPGSILPNSNVSYDLGNIDNQWNNVFANNANFAGNVSASNFVTTGSSGNISGANVIFANSFTSNGGVVDFATNNPNVQLGNVGNVFIYGGAAGQVLQTDGAGNLTWSSSANVNEIHNGNSNVSVPVADGNVYVNANASVDQQWVFDTNGYLTTPGDINLGGSSINDNNFNGIQLYSTNYTQLNWNNTDYLYIESGGTRIESSGNTWQFDEAGNLNLPKNASGASQVIQYGTGNLVVYNDGGQTLGVYDGSNFGYENMRINPGIEGSADIFLPSDPNASSQALTITNGAGDIQIRTNGDVVWDFNRVGILTLPNSISGYAEIDSQAGENMTLRTGGSDFSQIILNDGGDALIYTNAQNWGWAFGHDGQLTTAGNVNPPSNVTNDLGNTIAWWSNAYIANLFVDTANISGNIEANYANIHNDLEVGGNANVAGNITTGGGAGGNISGVSYLFADYANITYDINAGGNANITGDINASNITANYFFGTLANGSSNISIPNADGNIELTVNGSANVLELGQYDTTLRTNANITGNVTVAGYVLSNVVSSWNNSTLTIKSGNDGFGDYNINLIPAGSGNVDVDSTYITSVANPVNPRDAATKEYVDNVSQGLYIHPAANVLAAGNLNATYAQGGTLLTVTDIINGDTVQFSGNHGLSINDDITFTNSFNGIIGGDEYFVDTIPAPNQITLRDTWFGPLTVGLTNGSGLSEPALGNGGVGATLENAGTQEALAIDGETMTVGARVLVIAQTNAYENGIYDVTTVGDGSTNWLLTRSNDGDIYRPKDASALCVGSYWFILQGTEYAGSSWTLSSPSGEIDIGVSNIAFTQFSKAGSYTAGGGIAINGTVISANTDGVTTAIIAGNIAVPPNAQFTTPNIGDATGSSLSVSGNVNAGNVITGSGSGGNITGVNYLFANVANLTQDLNAGGNVVAGNITANNYIYASYANISNDAFVYGNANISGNLTAGNSYLGYTTITGDANVTGNSTVSGYSYSTNFAVVGSTLSEGGQLVLGYVGVNNITGQANGTWNIDVDGSNNFRIFTQYANAAAAVPVTVYANTDVSFSSNVEVNGSTITLGDTSINSSNVTTSSISANQALAQVPVSGITGVEFFVKGVDAAGGKYSVATITAVTDGTNVDFSTYALLKLGQYTGSFNVDLIGSNIALMVTPSSSNTTVWTTQFRTI